MGILTRNGYSLKYNLTHPHEVIMHFFRDIHCAWQRATKGYCYRDLWNIDDWFLQIMPQMLVEHNKNRHGYPNGLTDEQWNDIILEMADCFKNADEETTDFVNPYEKEYLATLSFDIDTCELNCSASEELENSYRKYQDEEEAYLKQNLEKGFELFVKHFRSLWD